MQYLMKVLLVVIVLLMAVAINIPAEYMKTAGIDVTALKGGLLACVVVGLFVYRALAMMIFTLLLVFGANMPDELAELWGIDRRLLIGTLVLMVAMPIYHRLRWGY